MDTSGLDPDKVGDLLTIHTAELEETVHLQDFYEKVVVAKLLNLTPHPESDKLSIAQFDCGDGKSRQVIFGQKHPLHEGKLYPVALPGAKLLSGIEVTSSTLRGQQSDGMVCDNQDLGMKNPNLITFPTDTPLGKSLSELFAECRDVLFDIDNKSLTHRPDLMGHIGFVREVAAITKRKKDLTLPEPPLPTSGEKFSVEIQTPNCRRFCAGVMSNIEVKISPLETIFRLEHLGTRSISNLVDITNIALLGWGQPMHVFDADKIDGHIIVRQARKGEKLIALDENEYELTPEDIVIADEKKVLSIAGVMGGLASSVTEKTKNIVFECANFDPTVIRKTSTRLGLRSESSMRYEKSLDPEQCLPVLKGALALTLERIPAAQIAAPITDTYPTKLSEITVLLDPELVNARSGFSLTPEQVQTSLEALDFTVTHDEGRFLVQIPSFRATKDVSIPEDLVEEVVRLEGFDKIESQALTLPVRPPHPNHLRSLEWTVRDFFASREFLEVYNYSFVPTSDKDFTQSDSYISVQNPLSAEQALLRRTLASNLIRDIEPELRTHGALHAFELGKTYIPRKDDVLPDERLKLGLISTELGGDEDALFYALKDELERLAHALGVKISARPCTKTDPFMHPSKAASLFCGDTELGQIFVLHPSQNTLKRTSIVLAELDMESLLACYLHRDESYHKISTFPRVHRDLSFLLDEKVLVGDLRALWEKNCNLLTEIELFDEFRDKAKFGAGKKNLSFHLTFQATDRTLTDEDMDASVQTLVTLAKDSFGAILRGEE